MANRKWTALLLAAVLLFSMFSFALGEEPEADTEAAVPVEIIEGETVAFGRYEQDNDAKNGDEPIVWDVLAVQDGKALMISQRALDAKPYNETYENVTWATCTLRAWLNAAFLSTAFTDAEQKCILVTTVDNSASQNPENEKYWKQGSEDTEDKVFLLSYAEAWQYYKRDRRRTCEATATAIARGVWTDTTNSCWWWLRSPGQKPNDAAGVKSQGYLNHRDVSSTTAGVRPVIWVDVAAALELLNGSAQ
ncbi:MAG: hypothetical protein IK127_05040 [Clostridia bacterium]|nr:hypothetical protein [Clostridia bacterium]